MLTDLVPCSSFRTRIETQFDGGLLILRVCVKTQICWGISELWDTKHCKYVYQKYICIIHITNIMNIKIYGTKDREFKEGNFKRL